MSVLTFDVGLAAKLKKRFAGAGWSEEDIAALANSDKLAQILEVVRGYASITQPKYLIDSHIPPEIPNGWVLYSSHGPGLFFWKPEEVKLFRAKSQEGLQAIIRGPNLQMELIRKRNLNATVLQYLLKHPHLIPEEWKQKIERRTTCIFFWGTVASTGLSGRCKLFVPYLYWNNHSWQMAWRELNQLWDCYDCAAVLIH